MFLEEFKAQCILRMEENLPRIEKCLGQLSEVQVWQRPNASSNSIGNLILHLSGNIGQYINSSLALEPDLRERDFEFSTADGYTKSELLEHITTTINFTMQNISMASEVEYLRSRPVQGFEMTGIGIVIHVVEHLSYHVGQIAFWTKAMEGKDLGFYANLDLNVKND